MDTAKTHFGGTDEEADLVCLPMDPLGKVPGPVAASASRDGTQPLHASSEPRLQLLEEREASRG